MVAFQKPCGQRNVELRVIFIGVMFEARGDTDLEGEKGEGIERCLGDKESHRRGCSLEEGFQLGRGLGDAQMCEKLEQEGGGPFSRSCGCGYPAVRNLEMRGS